MKQVNSPIQFNATGPEVGNLQAALAEFLARGALKPEAPTSRNSYDDLKKLAAKLAVERTQQAFGDATRQLVQLFQQQQNLADKSGAVDEKTAVRMNDLLRELGVQFEDSIYQVYGVVIDATGRRVAGLDIRAFDRDYQREAVLGQALTDTLGAYRISFPASLFRQTPEERGGPELFLRAYDEHGLLLAQSETVRNAGLLTEANLALAADLRIVSGTVRDTGGRGLPGLRVTAIDRDLRSSQMLDEATTDAQGRYQLNYTPAQFRRADKRLADLHVKVLNSDGDTELASSATQFNAPARVVLDFQVSAAAAADESELERHLAQIAPLLENLQPHSLSDQDLEFIAGETGIDAGQLRLLRLDAVWRREQATAKLPIGAFYGLLRQGLPQDLGALLRAGPRRWREALEHAHAARQIPATPGGSTEHVVAQLGLLAVEAALDRTPAEGSAPPTLGALLSGAAMADEDRRAIAAAVVEYAGAEEPEQPWQALTEMGVAFEAQRSARFALETHALLQLHLPTLTFMQRTVAREFGAASDLARLSREQWMQIAEGIVGADQLPREFADAAGYAHSLADRVEAAFPTAVVGYRLIEEPDARTRDVGQLLVLNPGFDFFGTAIDEFLWEARLGDIETPLPELKRALAREVRLARIAPPTDRAFNMQALRRAGFDSAFKVMHAGRTAFTRAVTRTTSPAAAATMYANARQRMSEVVLQQLRMRDYLDRPIPVLPRASALPNTELATWAALFGGPGGCACPPCGSALGPAAYLMDLFEFLKDTTARRGADSSLLDVLNARRPDLQHLKLDCANSEMPLPHIDLVVELLERQIAGAWGAESAPQTPSAIEGVVDVAAGLRAQPFEIPIAGLEAVYGELAGARHPWACPFDRNHAEAGVQFSLLGVDPARALDLTVEAGDAPARARLGLSPAEWTLLMDPMAPHADAVATAWGLGDASLVSLTTFTGAQGLPAKSGLSAPELFAFLESPLFAHWSLYVDRQPRPTDNPCDLAATRLRRRVSPSAPADLSAAERTQVFDFLHCALRLRLLLDWSLPRLQAALTALLVPGTAPALDLRALARLLEIAARLDTSVERVAQALRAFSAGDTLAAADWLTLLRIAPDEHELLRALELPDTLGDIAAPERLVRTVALLDMLAHLRKAEVDPAELRYLLRGVDLVPPVFAPRPSERFSQLDDIVNAIRAAAASEPAPAVASEISPARRALQVNAAVDRLTEITGVAFVADVIAVDAHAADLSVVRPALLDATPAELAGGVVQDFIAVADAATPEDDLARREIAIGSLARVTRVCRLLAMLGFTIADVRALRDLRGLFDFNVLPPRPASANALTLDSVAGLLAAAATQRAMPATERRLLEIIADANSGAGAIAAFERATGWTQVGPLAATLGLDTETLDTWRAPASYARVLAAMDWLRTHGLAADAHLSLGVLLNAARLPSALNVAALATLARARFALQRDYYVAMAPAMDRVRVRRRDALLAWLLHRDAEQFESADAVSDHLLIDVRQGPRVTTTRIAQAQAAIQTFVQRCLLNAENPAEVALGEISNIVDWRQWEWMKNYRTWEAGRKIYLFPENWIEPELRDDKSPIFEALENELLQGAITTQDAERALRSYLARLHEVADLETCALYEETCTTPRGDHDDTQRILHVIARTRALPHVYFHRRRRDDLTWQPWKKIDIDVEGEHLALAAVERRPMLFWPKWSDANLLRLQWSACEFGVWSPPRTSTGCMQIALNDRAGLTLRPIVRRGTLEVLVFEPGVEHATGRFVATSGAGDFSVQPMPVPPHELPNYPQPHLIEHDGRTLLAVRRSGAGYLLEAARQPFVGELLAQLREGGVDGLYRQPDEIAAFEPTATPRHSRQLTRLAWVDRNYPPEQFEFALPGTYSLYNWELYFHLPLLVATRLGAAGSYPEAQQWLHAIFDPTDVSFHGSPHKYWRVKPLFEECKRWAESGAPETLEEMLRHLSGDADDHSAQVRAWRHDPFNPQLLARLRPLAFMKAVLQKYLENLVAWGDDLFRRDTQESINEALQLYGLASHILGEAPVELPAVTRPARSYRELTAGDRSDEFSNVLVDAESLPVIQGGAGRGARAAPGLALLYFCIPHNERLRTLRQHIDNRLGRTQ